MKFNIYRNKSKYQDIKKIMVLALFFILTVLCSAPAEAIVDPLAVPNNKFGVHLIQATPEESSPAASLVNTKGDWGYVTILVESTQRNHQKWQTFFDDLRKRHLIPIIRLATEPEGNFWKRPYEGEEQAWADFLDNLIWPTKNRYVVIYNEPNHATEWGSQVDARDYAQALNKTIDALKAKSPDFFVMNAGFDASAPHKIPNYQDELEFLSQMDQAVPGIFNKLDGWVSHSYPNPGFVGKPSDTGRGTVRTWEWELQQLKLLGVSKNLPVFITETGWKHAEGINFDPALPKAEKVADFYKEALNQAWSSYQIVAVTPFLLSYQEVPFDHFSFKKYHVPDFYPQYQTLLDLPKIKGQPIQENKAIMEGEGLYPSLVGGETYTIPVTVKNIGQSIWNEFGQVRLVPTNQARILGINPLEIPPDQKIAPGDNFTFNLNVKAPQSGTYSVGLSLFNEDKLFDSPSLSFTIVIKTPVKIQVKTKLQWKNKFSGEYILYIAGNLKDSLFNKMQKIMLGQNGLSEELEEKTLIPDQAYDFILKKPFYKEKTIHQTVTSGVNILDFGMLQPDIPSAILSPKELWSLLPFSS